MRLTIFNNANMVIVDILGFFSFATRFDRAAIAQFTQIFQDLMRIQTEDDRVQTSTMVKVTIGSSSEYTCVAPFVVLL